MEQHIYELLKEQRTDVLISELQSNPAMLSFVDSRGASLLMISFYFRNKVLSDYLLSVRPPASLYEAVIAGDLKLTKQFLSADASLLNQHSRDGFTPLGFAAYFNQADIARYLIAQGADVNIASNNPFRVAPIHSAVSSNGLEVVELLLASGANPNVRQQNDVTPLMGAAHNKNLAIVTALLKAGANKDDRSSEGKTAYDWAKEVEGTEVMALLQ